MLRYRFQRTVLRVLLLLNPRWQAAMPALDPSLDSEAVRARWARACEER